MELLRPGGQREALETGLFAPRQALDVIDDAAHPLSVGADDLRQPPVVVREIWRFCEQLARMAHGSHWVTDLVRNAGTQASESSQLRLLDAFLDQAGIFQKDQHRSRTRCAQWRKMGADKTRAIRRHKRLILRRDADSGTLTPGLQEIEESR